VRIGAGRERRHFLVADVDPFDGLLSADFVGYTIKRIANYSVDSLDPSRGERCH
jgi:hypothetical protein